MRRSSFRPGSHLATGSSRPILPSSMSWRATAAVNVFETEARANAVSAVTSRPVEASATPLVPVHSRPSSQRMKRRRRGWPVARERGRACARARRRQRGADGARLARAGQVARSARRPGRRSVAGRPAPAGQRARSAMLERRPLPGRARLAKPATTSARSQGRASVADRGHLAHDARTIPPRRLLRGCQARPRGSHARRPFRPCPPSCPSGCCPTARRCGGALSERRVAGSSSSSCRGPAGGAARADARGQVARERTGAPPRRAPSDVEGAAGAAGGLLAARPDGALRRQHAGLHRRARRGHREDAARRAQAGVVRSLAPRVASPRRPPCLVGRHRRAGGVRGRSARRIRDRRA